MLEILIYRTWAINIPVLLKRNLKNVLTIVTESVTSNELLKQPSFQGCTRLRPQVTGILETMGTSRLLLCDYF